MSKPDIRTGRLTTEEISRNFGDMHPPLSRSEALIEADRCYFCYDAPCTTACPTGIDIPGFIQKIRSYNVLGSAQTILRENIMGGMCARVCPTEVLCEEACVRHTHEDKPVNIGRLQRYATDPVFERGLPMFERAKSTGKSVAVVGGGPAGLSCAHRLAMLGHRVVVFNRDSKLGGLNEYGIAAYKTVNDFAQREVEWILKIGGIEVRANTILGADVTFDELRQGFDAVFLGFGLGGVNDLGLGNEDSDVVMNAVDFIADIRQAEDKSSLPTGRRVVVIGGGMTAIDVAVQSKRLGSEEVQIVYRRGPEKMGASQFEREFAQTNGVGIRYWSMPVKLEKVDGATRVHFESTEIDENGDLLSTGETWIVDADIVFKAVGQAIDEDTLGLVAESIDQRSGRLVVDEQRRTSLEGVWAGGDCIYGHDDLTVTAVQDGKLAAFSIDRQLRGK
ncbi:MAG: NAD(P)-dependent oxidoreductase [Proteobacteria bacterium]|nr:NAD(P)-dependent oxidoreductase [Pseudomonadota bacterium]MDA0993313.1 NAD(P)-dependent oxidoreductase [Pseudomonadota bacterium]